MNKNMYGILEWTDYCAVQGRSNGFCSGQVDTGNVSANT